MKYEDKSRYSMIEKRLADVSIQKEQGLFSKAITFFQIYFWSSSLPSRPENLD